MINLHIYNKGATRASGQPDLSFLNLLLRKTFVFDLLFSMSDIVSITLSHIFPYLFFFLKEY